MNDPPHTLMVQAERKLDHVYPRAATTNYWTEQNHRSFIRLHEEARAVGADKIVAAHESQDASLCMSRRGRCEKP